MKTDHKQITKPCDFGPPLSDVQEEGGSWWPGKPWTAETKARYQREALMKPVEDRWSKS